MQSLFLKFYVEWIVFAIFISFVSDEAMIVIQSVHDFPVGFGELEIENVKVFKNMFLAGCLWNNDCTILKL